MSPPGPTVPIAAAAGANPAVLAASAASAAAEGTEALVKAAGRSPRFAIVSFSLVGALVVILGFVHLQSRVSALPVPLPTTGDWITAKQLDAALASMKAEQAVRDAGREERLTTLLKAIERIESRQESQGNRIDRLYERTFGVPPK